jgi:asparagine synthase (glutamine-hydrolysing)
MCGIAGVFHFDGKKVSSQEIKKMTDRIAYRGPDAEGSWISHDGALGLGHRRLSILDLSEAGTQPMHYGDGRYSITFNGEIYNYLELRAELAKKGHQFRTGTDTEVLLALYAEKKEACLSRLDGMFAFAIWDREEKTLFCARDRFGEKPFFYAFEAPRRFVFASEMKCVFEAGFGKAAREDRLYSYLAHNVAEDPFDLSSTFYQGISQIAPAHYLKVFSDGSSESKCYWEFQPEEEAPPPLPFDQACQRYYELFEVSLKRRLRSDVPIGTCLSGGLDSSSIAVLLDRLLQGSGQPLKTFSARMPDKKKDEGVYMQEVIAKTRSEPHFTWLDPERLADEIDSTFYHNEEPILWSSVMAHRQVMQLAKSNNVPVLIDGQGPDEMVAGYTGAYPIYFRELYLTDPGRLSTEIAAYQRLRGTKFRAGNRFKLEARFPGAFYALGALGRRYRMSQNLRDITPGHARRHNRDLMPFPRFTRLNESLRYATTRRGLSYLLRMCDRNSMAFAIEVRLPFLFHELAEFSINLPAHYKIRDGWSKYILRKAMEPLLPPAIAWRPDKIGFESPQDEWLDHPRFKERVEGAVALLQKENWIGTPVREKRWQYIFAAKVLQNDL